MWIYVYFIAHKYFIVKLPWKKLVSLKVFWYICKGMERLSMQLKGGVLKEGVYVVVFWN